MRSKQELLAEIYRVSPPGSLRPSRALTADYVLRKRVGAKLMADTNGRPYFMDKNRRVRLLTKDILMRLCEQLKKRETVLADLTVGSLKDWMVVYMTRNPVPVIEA